MRGSGRTTLRPGRKLRCVARQLGTQGAPFCDAARYPPYPPLGNPSSLHLQFHSHSQRQAGADAHSLTWGTEARRAAASVQGCQRGAPMYKPIPYTYAPPAALRHHQLGGEKARLALLALGARLGVPPLAAPGWRRATQMTRDLSRCRWERVGWVRWCTDSMRHFQNARVPVCVADDLISFRPNLLPTCCQLVANLLPRSVQSFGPLLRVCVCALRQGICPLPSASPQALV